MTEIPGHVGSRGAGAGTHGVEDTVWRTRCGGHGTRAAADGDRELRTPRRSEPRPEHGAPRSTRKLVEQWQVDRRPGYKTKRTLADDGAAEWWTAESYRLKRKQSARRRGADIEITEATATGIAEPAATSATTSYKSRRPGVPSRLQRWRSPVGYFCSQHCYFYSR